MTNLRTLLAATAHSPFSTALVLIALSALGCDTEKTDVSPAAAGRDEDQDGHTYGADCDDTDPTVFPGATDTWYDGVDSDCAGDDDYDADGDGYDLGVDCDDTDDAVYPGAPDSWYDGTDADCGLNADSDQDGDGFALADDCDDTDATIFPGAVDAWYDGVDSDCAGNDDDDMDSDGFPVGSDCDDADPATFPGAPDAWYDGTDSDCAGNDDNDADADGYPLDLDCDDTDAAVNPSATDTWYDGVDADCDGSDDFDADGDGYDFSVDCDDRNAEIHPGAAEVWYDGIDGDCDGADDFDADGDSYAIGTDCDDTDATVYPGAPDAWYDGIDSDCAGDSDNDADNDGFPVGPDCDDIDASVYPEAPDAWYDGIDSDCAGDDDFDADLDGFPLGDDCDDEDATIYPGSDPSCPVLDTTPPEVLSTNPEDGATNVATPGEIIVVFTEDVDPASVNAGTFRMNADGVPIAGTIRVSGDTAVFVATDSILGATLFEAELTSEVTDRSGNPLAITDWSWSTPRSTIPALGVDLGSAGDFAVLAQTGISTVPTSSITGDIGISPAAATYITGFSLTLDASNEFATSTQVVGMVFAADYAPPTPNDMTNAIGDMGTAFTDAAGRAPDVTELGAGNIGGMTLTAGVYKWGTGLLIPTDVTLEGNATDVWIFEIGADLTVANGARVSLAGGADPQNIYWQVSGLADFGTTSHMEGVVLSQTSITLRTRASINGRLLAQSAVDIDSATIVAPTP